MVSSVPAKVPDAMSTINLTCLGTGDGHPSVERSHSAFLYEGGGATVLMDCGEPVMRNLKQRGMSPDAIDRVFLSHLHSDHLGGFFMLIQGFWLGKREQPLTVHLPAEGLEPVRRLLRAAYLFDGLLPFELRFETWQDAAPVSLGGLTVTPHCNTHLEWLRENYQSKYPDQAFEAFSFTLEANGKRAAHSADIGQLSDLDVLLAQPLDLLVCELSHLEPADLFEYLAGRSIGRVVFTHVSQRHWRGETALRELADKQLGNLPHVFAVDGEEISL